MGTESTLWHFDLPLNNTVITGTRLDARKIGKHRVSFWMVRETVQKKTSAAAMKKCNEQLDESSIGTEVRD